jgi:prefoldin subunit 5
MSPDTPSIAEQVAALESDLSGVQQSATLASLRDRVEDIGATIERLPGALKQVRDRGYLYKNFLENKIKVLSDQWGPLKPQVEREIRTHAANLQRALQAVEAEMTKLRAAGTNVARAKPLVRTVEGGIKDLESKVQAAERAVAGMFDTVETNIQQTNRQIEEIAWLLDQVDQSAVEWSASERPIIGVRAKWWREGKKQGPDGVLYLTNERLAFEQKEEVATKKVLFIATEKETVQEFLLAAPIGAIAEVKASHMGLGGHQDHIDLTFGPGVDYPIAHFHLQGQDCEMWQATINRVKSGEIEREMVALSAAEVERMAQEAEAISNAPTACPTCGATFTQSITKGMHEITCEYCGSVTRF